MHTMQHEIALQSDERLANAESLAAPAHDLAAFVHRDDRLAVAGEAPVPDSRRERQEPGR